MEQRRLGRTGLAVSVLGYGCGAVGGLTVRGSAAGRDQTMGRAIDAGITYFDTAATYGDGEAERDPGRTLRALRADVVVGTEVRIAAGGRGAVGGAIAASLDASLRRLGRDSIDLFQLHDRGKARWFGVSAPGDAAALRQVLDGGAFVAAQVPYPTACSTSAPPERCPRARRLPLKRRCRPEAVLAGDTAGLAQTRALAEEAKAAPEFTDPPP